MDHEKSNISTHSRSGDGAQVGARNPHRVLFFAILTVFIVSKLIFKLNQMSQQIQAISEY